MTDENKKYWFYIFPHVYCCIKDTEALLYNTKTGENIETRDQNILYLLNLLHNNSSLGVIEIDKKSIEKVSSEIFFPEFCSKGMGNLIEKDRLPEKPIQLMPVLNIQQDWDKLQKTEERDAGENILQYLLELNIYLHTICSLDCPHCNTYSHQSLCCMKTIGDQQNTLDIYLLQKILFQIKHGSVGKLNLLGGDIMEYPDYKDIKKLLDDFNGNIFVWNHYANFKNNRSLISDFSYEISVNFPLDVSIWVNTVEMLRHFSVRYNFFIISIDEYKKTESLIKQFNISNYAIHPVYIKTNRDFFEENVYTNREDILNNHISFRQLFAHQKLNTSYFGKLTILPDGNVFANINDHALGNVKHNSLLDIIYTEMSMNTSWRRIRDITPCCDCLYQYLCPSPSDYEKAIGKINLCHIK